MSTQFKFIAAYLKQGMEDTSRIFIWRVIAHITHNSIRNFVNDVYSVKTPSYCLCHFENIELLLLCK